MRGPRAGAAPPTDLLVCFPSRSHLALTHKPVNSPSRPSHRSQSSPLFRAPPNKSGRPNRSRRTQLGSDIGSEPTSPKVTCAGQIKVRPRENLAGPRRKNWVEALGVKKDVMNFLGALRSLRLSMQCFGSFSGAVDCCSDEEEEDGEEEEETGGGGSQSRSVFSKWLRALEEENGAETKNGGLTEEEEEEEEIELPPKNALLLMRCRSAPEKGREEEEEEEKPGDKEEEEEEERLMLMSYAPDFFKLSTEIAKETWVVGSVGPLARSRSWRR